ADARTASVPSQVRNLISPPFCRPRRYVIAVRTGCRTGYVSVSTAELVRPARLFHPDRIATMDRAPALDCRVDTDADLVVLRRRAQDTRIRWEVPLGQGRHDAAATRPGDAQANGISDGERV